MTPLHVLIVDDSAVVREILRTVFSYDPSIRADTAADPLIAIRKIAQKRPDVILLDLEMPGMDGMTFLRKIMKEIHPPIPVIVCTIHADIALQALKEGAVEILTKPKIGLREFLEESSVLFIDAVRSAAAAVSKPEPQQNFPPKPRLSADVVLPPLKKKYSLLQPGSPIIVLGASTGGTEAIATVLAGLPENAPGMVVVQHMPENFTRAFARHLDSISSVSVKEAEHGDLVRDGHVLIAPGNRHTLIVRHGKEYRVEVISGPLVSRHRPSVDVLFRSAAVAAGSNAIGVILTGMGDDGAQGMLELKRVGAVTLAQDEASCIVFGMPREAIVRGGIDRILPLNAIARGMLQAAEAINEGKGSAAIREEP